MKGETVKTLKKQIVRGRRAAEAADATEPRVKSARYDVDSGRIVIDLKNGSTFMVPASMLQGLAGKEPSDLADMEVTPSGGDYTGRNWTRT